MLGLTIFVYTLTPLTSGQVFGLDNENGRTVLSGGLTLALLILPIIIVNAQEAIRAVPSSFREASYGLGATKLQTVRQQVLPSAIPGILTGVILALSRAVGETAPLLVVGASTFLPAAPDGPFSKFTVVPIQIYQWTANPDQEFRNVAAAAIIVLLVVMLLLNSTAIILRNRYSRS
jgi:phosphate transport system permease protein